MWRFPSWREGKLSSDSVVVFTCGDFQHKLIVTLNGAFYKYINEFIYNPWSLLQNHYQLLLHFPVVRSLTCRKEQIIAVHIEVILTQFHQTLRKSGSQVLMWKPIERIHRKGWSVGVPHKCTQHHYRVTVQWSHYRKIRNCHAEKNEMKL